MFRTFVVSLLLTSNLAYAKISGHVRLRMLQYAQKYTNNFTHTQSQYLLNPRFNWTTDLNETAQMELAHESFIYYAVNKEINFASNEVSGSRYRLIDFDEYVNEDKLTQRHALLIAHNFDRALVTYTLNNWTLLAGRQAIAWGAARFVNPTDVLRPFSILAINREHRFGIDAFRLRRGLGDIGELDFGIVLGKDAEDRNNAYYVRTILPLQSWEPSLLLLRFQENYLVGFSLPKTIGGFGTWLEMAQVWLHESQTKNYFRSSIGAEYYFPFDLTFSMEYHFNGGDGRC